MLRFKEGTFGRINPRAWCTVDYEGQYLEYFRDSPTFLKPYLWPALPPNAQPYWQPIEMGLLQWVQLMFTHLRVDILCGLS